MRMVSLRLTILTRLLIRELDSKQIAALILNYAENVSYDQTCITLLTCARQRRTAPVAVAKVQSSLTLMRPKYPVASPKFQRKVSPLLSVRIRLKVRLRKWVGQECIADVRETPE